VVVGTFMLGSVALGLGWVLLWLCLWLLNINLVPQVVK
jgi:hypothetical protein